MDFSTGGQGTSDSQRQAASQIARNRVLASYSNAAKNLEEAEETEGAKDLKKANLSSKTREAADEVKTSAEEVLPKVANETTPGLATSKARDNREATWSRGRSKQETNYYKKPTQQETVHLKERPIEQKINSESWRRYHSAWQDYYQKYYSDYYSRAARNYIEKEKLKTAREQASEEDILSGIPKLSSRQEEKASSSLRTIIRRKATDNAKKTRRFRKFIPIMAGIAVTCFILFLQYNRLIFAPIMAYVSPGNAPASEIEALDPTITQTISPDPRLIIPKLNIDVPVRFGIPASDVMEAMNNGVAHFRITGASAFPGEVGNFVITGHSAGDVYSSNPYKFIFSGLERLENGDLIYVNYNSTRYTYQVVKKEIVEPSNIAALTGKVDKPIITLITCTPLGTSRYRLLVTGEQISPVNATATSEDPVETETDTEALPANEPSFFEGIWNWLTGK